MINILNAASADQLDHVRDLMHAFVKWHRQLHQEDLQLIDRYFDSRDFEEELSTLPGKYSSPEGRLLLAYINEQPAGCVALRKIDAQRCEMKRMFVYTDFHGKGVGKALAEKLLKEARSIGYSSMLLDTSFRQIAAQRLYESLGFKRIEPYYELPDDLANWLVFMELKL